MVGVWVWIEIGMLDQASHNLPYRRRQMVQDYVEAKALDSSSGY